MRTLSRAAFSVLTATGLIVGLGIGTHTGAHAAQGSGKYPNWTYNQTTSSGTISFGRTYPEATFVTNASGPSPDEISIDTEDFLNASTPFGKRYGSSEGSSYLIQRHTALGGPWTTVITFEFPMPAGTWAFALSDLDVDNVTISATNANGKPAKISPWFESAFNFCMGADQPGVCDVPPPTAKPIWDGVDTLRGPGDESEGATAWFRPTIAITSLTLRWTAQPRWANSSYRLWMAADARVRQQQECATLPATLPSAGVTRISAANCTTDAGQPVTVTATCVSATTRVSPRGDFDLCRQITSPRGAVSVETFGHGPTIVTILVTARAINSYRAYRSSQSYIVG